MALSVKAECEPVDVKEECVEEESESDVKEECLDKEDPQMTATISTSKIFAPIRREHVKKLHS